MRKQAANLFFKYRAWLERYAVPTPSSTESSGVSKSLHGHPSWRERFQKDHGNVFSVVPVGKNARRFPQHHHSFHILGPSPWPVCLSASLFVLVSGLVDLLAADAHYGLALTVGLLQVLLCLWCWWKDVVEESLTQHTKRIKRGIAIGMVLFIVSEVMFFFSFFWAFFHVSLAPSVELGCVWPPKGLETLVISPFGAPLLNTVILLASGVTVTCAHYAFLAYCYRQRRFMDYLGAFGDYLRFAGLRAWFVGHGQVSNKAPDWAPFSQDAVLELKAFVQGHGGASLQHYSDNVRITPTLWSNLHDEVFPSQVAHPTFLCSFRHFLLTLGLAVFFTISQGLEYLDSAVCISDGVYGSTFFVMTGFHGFHVVVGTIFLAVCFGRILKHRYSFVHFVGLECAIWYWHFVDVVWLFLFFFVYYWGNAFVPVVDYSLFGAVAHADFAHPFQPDFQDSASVLMESIVDLHNYIMFYLWVVLGMVAWMLLAFAVAGPANRAGQLFALFRLLASDLRSREYAVRRLYFMTNRDVAKRFPGLARAAGAGPNQEKPPREEIPWPGWGKWF